MYAALLVILVLVSVFLVIFILMQSDKGGGLSGTLGGMGGGGLPFSGREAATILTKLTTGLAISFMVICIFLSVLSRHRASSASSNSALQKRAEKMSKIQNQSASAALDQALPMGPEGGAPGQGAPDGGAIPMPTPEAQPAAPAQQAPAPAAPLFPAGK